jgi:dTDP-4-dehydrorhamnose reductase
VLVIRTAWVAAPGHANFVTRILERARAGEQLQVVDDQTGSPTFAADLARATLDAVRLGLYGLAHIVNGGEATRCQLARAALSLAGLDPGLVSPIASEQLSLPAARPRYSVLGTQRPELSPLPDWQTALAGMIASDVHRE